MGNAGFISSTIGMPKASLRSAFEVWRLRARHTGSPLGFEGALKDPWQAFGFLHGGGA